MRTIRRLGSCLMLAALTGCATSGSMDVPAVAGPMEPAGQRYVATRTFHLREAPTMDGTPLRGFRTGDTFSGRVRPVDEVWTWMMLDRGDEGYVFGRPYRADDGRQD